MSDSDDERELARSSTATMLSSPTKGLTLALTSGVFAALAGTFGKFAMTRNETLWLCETVSFSSFNFSHQEAYIFCDKSALYMQILAFGTMILMNVFMWSTFVKALRYCKTSLEATVTNTAANFFSSAVVGQFVFEESVTLLWWLGTLLIVFGIGLMNYGGKVDGKIGSGHGSGSGSSGRRRMKTSSKKHKLR